MICWSVFVVHMNEGDSKKEIMIFCPRVIYASLISFPSFDDFLCTAKKRFKDV